MGESGHIGRKFTISAFWHSEVQEAKELDIWVREIAKLENPFSGKGRGHILEAVWRRRTCGSIL
jgi:hypothetical protein